MFIAESDGHGSSCLQDIKQHKYKSKRGKPYCLGGMLTRPEVYETETEAEAKVD